MKLIFVSLLFLVFRGIKSTNHESRKNIILILTDDQDIELGSMDFMPKTVKLLRDKGVEMAGGFVTTPICCPSRSSILTGRYVHNHNVQTNNQNCSGPMWKSEHEPRVFGKYVQDAGYVTSYMGKYLNEYDGSYIPPGWDNWMGLIRNSRFYNYTVNCNGQRKKYGYTYEKHYFTDLITNETLRFLSNHFILTPDIPILSVLSYPAPHGPEDPAPQYADMFNDADSHRTEAWNYAPNPDKQWLLQRTGKMEPVHVAFTDILHRRRLQTLQSVDDAVHRILSLLRDFNQLANTYVIYTSDHGYHLGQFGLIKGKNMPYEFDIRVPFLMRGPGIPKNITIRRAVANIDIAPTILDMAGVVAPDHMDGRSLLDLVVLTKGKRAPKLEPWRDTVLIERGKMPKLKKIRDRFFRQRDRFSKELRLSRECQNDKYSGTCAEGQSWKCYMTENGRWRIYKCRGRGSSNCDCERIKRNVRESEDELEDEFLREAHQERILESEQWFQGVFGVDISSKKRNRRTLDDKCRCGGRNNTEHPLKHDDGITDDLLYSYLGPRHGKRRKGDRKNDIGLSCALPQMNCFTHSSNHWRTPPLWPEEYGEFCFCQNSNNNTYWCLRTLNETHNFLYCEFVTEFISYYDMNTDPFQLTNTVYSLDVTVLESLSEQLRHLRACKGRDCEKASSRRWSEYPAPPTPAPTKEMTRLEKKDARRKRLHN